MTTIAAKFSGKNEALVSPNLAAFDLGYEDYIYSESYCLIEWPEMIESLLPEKMVEVKIEVQDDDTRLIIAQEI